MTSSQRFLAILVFLVCSSYATIAQQPSFHYTVSMPQPGNHRFLVRLDCKGLQGVVIDLKMPSWMPGYYQLLDYAQHVSAFKAFTADGKSLAWEHTEHNTWRIAHAAGQDLHITYEVAATTAFVAQPWLDSTHAYISPAGVFLYAAGYIRMPVTVTIQPASGWKDVATGLEPVASSAHTFRAADFDILFDSPILVGNLESAPCFKVKGIPHYFTGYQMGRFDQQQLSNDLQKLITVASDIIGDIPYQHYTFLAIGPGRGGIEHLNSSTISFTGKGLETPAGRQQMLSFISHEYFHHYNVKRIRPIALGPFDYDQENRTNMLWVSEGLTVYYEYMMMKRAGLMDGAALLTDFSNNIAAYETQPGHLYQSLAQASWETWSDGPFGRKGDTINKTISYYDKGPAVGLLLDLAIRHATQNKRSLDDVMRQLYRKFYQQAQRGFTDDEFRQVCESTAGAALPEIFDYVYTVNAPDYAKYLAYGGLAIEPGTFKIYPLEKVDALQAAIRKSWLGE